MEDNETYFSRLAQRGWGSGANVVMGGETDEQLAEGFLEAGDVLLDFWQQQRGPGSYELVFPMLYNYRHAIELSLKAMVLYAASCHVRFARDKDDRWQRSSAELRLSNTHSIAHLVEELQAAMATLHGVSPLDEDTLEVLQSLHAVGPWRPTVPLHHNPYRQREARQIGGHAPGTLRGRRRRGRCRGHA